MWLAVITLFFTSAILSQSTPQRSLPFSEAGWTLAGDRTAIVKYEGRDVLQVETGFAHRRDIRMENGTIDFDVELTKRRSFVYVYFRAVSDDEREEFYLRPHKSELPDAVQYAPVWQGRSAWQLHHGPGGTAAIGFEPGVWTHVRVVMQGRHAALFVKDMVTPALLVSELSREPKAGFLSLGGFLPADVPGKGPIARFANVVVRPDATPFDFAAAIAKSTAPAAPGESTEGIVRAWSVSRSFLPKDGDAVPSMPSAELLGDFQRVDAEPNGLVQLHRHVRMPEKSNRAAAMARVRVHAAQAGTYSLDLGFSDIATVFLNGRAIFRGDATYAFDRPRREGLIGFNQARLYLPLAAGDNDLAVVVSDSFGGWGLMARFVAAKGVTVESPMP